MVSAHCIDILLPEASGIAISKDTVMKIGFLSIPLSGHLNPMTALARRLQSRGHEIVFIGIPDTESAVRAAGLMFLPYCEEEYPAGSMARILTPAAKMRGLPLLDFAHRELIPGLIEAAFKHLPGKLIEAGVEALLVDTIHTYTELVPMKLGIPYVHIWVVLHADTTGATPLMYFDWPYENTPEAHSRNLGGWKMIESSMMPSVIAVAKDYASANGQDIDWNNPVGTYSKLAVITQTPKAFDFRDPVLSAGVDYAGPLHDDEGRAHIEFPWEELKDDKTLIYASLGTLVNGLEEIYRTILKSAGDFPELQFVISAGINVNLYDLEPIPPNAIVVDRAPQLELLKRAALCITHAGLNTALETLAQGVPMVAIPLGFDQPGVASRIAYHGVGEFVAIDRLTAAHLSGLISTVLSDPTYRDRARTLQAEITHTSGLDIASDIVERVLEDQ
jgi:zeaxanthin glucosyltransferase